MGNDDQAHKIILHFKTSMLLVYFCMKDCIHLKRADRINFFNENGLVISAGGDEGTEDGG